MAQTIFDYVEQEKQFYENQDIPLMAGDDYSQYQLIRAINFTRRSKYIDDNAVDDIIGDFPYDNISKYRIRLEARSTDFDIKHMEVAPVDSSDEARISSLVASKALHKKLRDIKFGKFMNRFNYVRPEYGAGLAKKTDEGVHVVPWENVVTDMGDIINSPIIEMHYLSPAQLKKTGWDNLDDAITSANEKKKKKDMKNSSSTEADTMGRFIQVNEVHGELSLATLKMAKDEKWEDEDVNEFVWCSIIYAPMGKDKDGKQSGVVLKADEVKEEDFPYKLDVRHPMTGRGFGEGIPEELSEHQRWHNFYKTEEARAVAIGGKILFITNDGSVADSIYDEGIEHGTILQYGEEKDFRQLNTAPSSVPVYQSISADWDESADKNTNSFDAVLGEESKSGTPFRAQYLQNLSGMSQFEQEREDIGFFYQEVIEDWLLPEALDEASQADQIDDIFTKQELQLIDRVLVDRAVLASRVDSTLGSKVISPESDQLLRETIQNDLARKGSRRNIKGIQEFIKNAGDKVVIHTTDEQRSKQVLFESYSNAIALVGNQTPAGLALTDRVLDELGVSREELAMYADEAVAVASEQPTASGAKIETEALAAEEQLAPTV